MSDKVAESLQFAERFREVRIQNGRTNSIDSGNHLVKEVLMHRRPSWNVIVNIPRQAQQDVLNSIVNIMHTE
jgi:hypothetical protein